MPRIVWEGHPQGPPPRSPTGRCPPYSLPSSPQARQVLGRDKLLVVGLSVVPDNDRDGDRDRAHASARERGPAGLGQPSYAVGWARWAIRPRRSGVHLQTCTGAAVSDTAVSP
ncbi:hypothetical protein [Streptomyces sp. NPDC090798]|uniref:hypothetical protein n=1 Tax=Streptomyces sp. NPDC090798 TaxID=3365968 RepID=UPI0038250313